MPSGFDDFVVTETISGDQEKRSYLQVYIESLDLLNVEFESRFSSENVLLWEAVSPLSPASNHYLDHEALKPLFDDAEEIPAISIFLVENELNSNDLKAEIRIFSCVFSCD